MGAHIPRTRDAPAILTSGRQPSCTSPQIPAHRPSGIMSLVSPSAAASVADADEETSPSQKISGSDPDAVEAAAAAAVTLGTAGAAAAVAAAAAPAAAPAAQAVAPGAVGAQGLTARLAAAAAAGASGGVAPMDVPRAAAAAVAAVAAAKAEAVAAAEARGEGEPESPKSNISGSVRTG